MPGTHPTQAERNTHPAQAQRNTHPTRADRNKDVVRRFYEAVLREPGGPDFATIRELTDEQEVELNWGTPTAASTGAPPSARHDTGCTCSPAWTRAPWSWRNSSRRARPVWWSWPRTAAPTSTASRGP